MHFTCRFLLGTLTYFIVGALVMKFYKGAKGKELIPNYGFWSELLLLIKVHHRKSCLWINIITSCFRMVACSSSDHAKAQKKTMNLFSTMHNNYCYSTTPMCYCRALTTTCRIMSASISILCLLLTLITLSAADCDVSSCKTKCSGKSYDLKKIMGSDV